MIEPGARVICINDKNRPAEFPESLWIKKNQKYTIAEVDRMSQQGGIVGVTLVEIDTSLNFPYTHYNANRFAPIDDDELQDLLSEALEFTEVEEKEMEESLEEYLEKQKEAIEAEPLSI